MNIQQAIQAVLDGQNLSRQDMQAVMQQIMTGEATDSQIGGFLIGLRMKGETVDEITAAADVMASLASSVELDVPNLIDIVGTGGDGTSTFNISTASSFVAAAAGAYVAKHGNRSVSSKSGSADLLEQSGANINLQPQQVAQVVQQAHVGFMFAPLHHSAMKHAIGPRKEMAVRTIFNVLGPLTNPAHVKRQLIGVFNTELTEVLANVSLELGREHVLVVHSEDGMDEISISAPTKVAEMKNGKVHTFTIQPEDFSFRKADMQQIVVANPEQSLKLIDDVLNNKSGAARDIVAMNAGAGIYVSGLVDSLQEGVQKAQAAIADGSALATRQAYIDATNSVA